MLVASILTTWIAFGLTKAAPSRSPYLHAAKVFLAFAFAWMVVEVIRYDIVTGGVYD